MRILALMILGLGVLGCGKKTTPAEPVTKPEPKVAVKKPEPANAGPGGVG